MSSGVGSNELPCASEAAIAERYDRGEISAVIVHYRSTPLQISRCVESCLRDRAIGEVLVVDNEGAAASRLRDAGLDRVRILEMPDNLGFGRAANAGLAAISESSALVLNQDTVLSEDAGTRLMEAGHAAGAWLVGPQLVDAAGTAAAVKEHLPWPMVWSPSELSVPEPPPSCRFVPWVSGAAMLFMPGHVDLRFDDRFFMYVEDEELCSRVWDAGGRVLLAEDATVCHEGGTAAQARWSRPEIAFRITMGRARFVRSRCGTVAASGFVVSAIVDRIRRGFARRPRMIL